jgi:proteic killer suppression protein
VNFLYICFVFIKMEIVFKNEILAAFYSSLKVKDKMLKSNPQLQKQYIKTINTLSAIDVIEDLFKFHSLNYEKLLGNLKGKSSVRINKQFRLIFDEIPDKNDVITILEIEEISKHYE